MLTQYTPYIIGLLLVLGVLYFWRGYKQFKKAKANPGELKKLVKIYLVVALVSIILYSGITIANIPVRMGWVQEIPMSQEEIEYLGGE